VRKRKYRKREETGGGGTNFRKIMMIAKLIILRFADNLINIYDDGCCLLEDIVWIASFHFC